LNKGKKKKHFYIRFHIEGIGTFKRYAWYVSQASFVKSLALEFEKKYPRLRIFIEVLEIKEIKKQVGHG